MFFLPLISSPSKSQLDAWALFHIPMISATSPCYYYAYKNHVSVSLSTYALILNWEKILCHRHYIIPLSKQEWENYSREEKNVQESKWSGGHDWIEWIGLEWIKQREV